MRSLTAAVAAALVLLPAAPAFAAGQAPVAVDDAVSVRNTGGIDHLVPALANDSDPDGDVLTYTAVTAAAKGNAFLRDGKLFYKPYLGNTGTDSFTYTVSDGQGNTATGTVTATLWVDPAAPAPLTISGSATDSVTLTWSATENAVQYRVHRSGALLGTTSSLTWTDSGLRPSSDHWYQVTAVSGGGWSGPASSNVFRRPQQQTPSNVVVDATGAPTTLSLRWNGGEMYGPWNVYRDGVRVASTLLSEYLDAGLTTGREYRYQVQQAFPSSASAVYPPSLLSDAVVATPGRPTPINRRFWELGGTYGALGPVTVAEHPIPGGRRQDHQNGLILQQGDETPTAVTRPFATAYIGAGGPGGHLGFPLSEQEGGLRDGGIGQFFEGGSIWTSSYTPLQVVRQVVEDGWAASGWEEGPLGYPVSDQMVLRGGVKQEFEGGDVYWSASTGSHGVASPLWEPFTAAGGENGRLGYPTADENCALRGGGCVQTFQGGLTYWSPTTGAHVVLGAIRTTYAKQGWENGRLGYPTTGELCGLRSSGCFQRFQGGSVYWSPASGAHVVLGAIRDRWAGQGWENGRLGYPTTSERCGLRGGGCFQEFQGGAIYWSPASGAHVVLGGIRDAWARQGWETGRLGYPVGGESFSGGAYRQTFQGGTIAIGSRGTTITYR